MKNKKLFAILTLVCFMFTLMPVAAFAANPYAWVTEGEEVVKTNDTVVLNAKNTSGSVIVFATKNDVLTADMKVAGVAGNGLFKQAGGDTTFNLTFAKAGTYTVHVVNANAYVNKQVDRAIAGEIKPADAAKLILDDATAVVTMDNNVIYVSTDAAVTYTLAAGADATMSTPLTKVSLTANGDTTPVWVELTAGGEAVYPATLNLSTNSPGVVLSADEVAVNPNGLAKFKVSAEIAGEFEVYIAYGDEKTLTLKVNANATAPAYIETVKEPAGPIATGTAIQVNDIQFAITDIHGNAINGTTLTGTAVDVKVVAAPTGSAVKNATIGLQKVNGVWKLYDENSASVKLDVEGDYTFKVILENGHSAEASVTVKKFQKPVSLSLIYPTNAVEVGGIIEKTAVNFVDANGVTKTPETGEVTLSATGYAIESFGADGKVTVKDNERYVGSKITVIAYSQKYNLTDTVELVVANEAAGIKYATNEADVAVNNTIVANIVDADGNKVALSTTSGAIAVSDIKFVVLEKPENAKVSLSATNTVLADLQKKGEFVVNFTASAIGEYKVQTIVSYNNNGVVKYYSGIETITVGNTGFDNIVVFSIGSDEAIVNNEIVKLEVAPFIENGRTMVQYRTIGEAFGADVNYEEATQSVTAELNGTTVVMTIGSPVYTINGVEYTADVAPYVKDGRTIVPVKFIAQAFGIVPTYTTNADGTVADVLFAK